MSLAAWLLNHPEWGWLLVLAAGAEQLFAPWQTRTKTLVDSRFDRLEEKVVALMTVVRALVRTDPDIDTERVDEILVENGVEPDDLIVHEPIPDGGVETDGAD